MRGRTLLGALLMLACSLPLQAKGRLPYKTAGDCDGFPRVELRTTPGLCVGLVASGLGLPRGIAVLGEDIYVADMGSWDPGRGRLLRLPRRGHGPAEVLLRKLDRPNSLAATPDRRLLIGLVGRIGAWNPEDAPAGIRDVVTGLPADGRHPLAAFALAPDGSLYVNVGARSDHCEDDKGEPPVAALPCPELAPSPPRAAVLRFAPEALPGAAAGAEVYARGIRNAMALVAVEGGILAAGNARDAIGAADPRLSDERLPHEPLMRLRQGADYGWPYCYDRGVASPEYPRHDCSAYAAPDLLLPAHAAPLGMIVLRAGLSPALEGSLLVGYHGYRSNGYRLVAVPLREGVPAGKPQEVVGGWDYAQGRRPRGAPVALLQMDDGSVLVSEDRNGTLLRLAPDRRVP